MSAHNTFAKKKIMNPDHQDVMMLLQSTLQCVTFNMQTNDYYFVYFWHFLRNTSYKNRLSLEPFLFFLAIYSFDKLFFFSLFCFVWTIRSLRYWKTKWQSVIRALFASDTF